MVLATCNAVDNQIGKGHNEEAVDLTAWRAWIRPLYENRITRDRHSRPFMETAHNKE